MQSTGEISCQSDCLETLLNVIMCHSLFEGVHCSVSVPNATGHLRMNKINFIESETTICFFFIVIHIQQNFETSQKSFNLQLLFSWIMPPLQIKLKYIFEFLLTNNQLTNDQLNLALEMIGFHVEKELNQDLIRTFHLEKKYNLSCFWILDKIFRFCFYCSKYAEHPVQ